MKGKLRLVIQIVLRALSRAEVFLSKLQISVEQLTPETNDMGLYAQQCKKGGTRNRAPLITD